MLNKYDCIFINHWRVSPFHCVISSASGKSFLISSIVPTFLISFPSIATAPFFINGFESSRVNNNPFPTTNTYLPPFLYAQQKISIDKFCSSHLRLHNIEYLKIQQNVYLHLIGVLGHTHIYYG